MKKYLFQQLWLVLCLVIMSIFVLNTAFNFSITVEDGQYELSEYCVEKEETLEKQSKSSGDLIQWNGKKLEYYGVNSEKEYTPISFLTDMGSRIISNFEISVIFITFKNLIVFVLLFGFTVSAFVLFVKGLVQGILNIFPSIKEVMKKDGEKRNIIDTKGMSAFYTPLILWGCVEGFRIYNSICLNSVFEVQNKITTVYYQGVNLLFIFIIFMVIYWLGRVAIKYLVRV